MIKDRKMPKWRIGLTFSQHFMIEVDALSEEEAKRLALIKIEHEKGWDESLQGYDKTITSVFINDRDSRDYSHFIPDGVDDNIDLDE